MNDIVLSKGIRSNLISLQNASALQDMTQNRLSTGRKVNSALDDPLNYFQSETLTTRSKDLTRLLDNQGLGIKTIEAADNGLKAITRMVEQMQAGLRTALNTAATNAKLASGMDLINKRAVDYLTNSNLVGSSGVGAAGAFAAGATLELKFDVPPVPPATGAPTAGTFTITFTNPMTAQDLVNQINSNTANNNTTTGERYINASIDAGGRLVIDNTTNGTLQLVLGGTGVPPNSLGTLFGTFEPPLPTSTATDTGVIRATTNPTRAKFAEQYNDLLTQITFAARDAGFNGTNLLYGQSLDMIFNEDATTRMVIRGVVFDSKGLGLSPSDTRRNMQSDTEINTGIARLGESIKLIRAQAATFGANNTVATTREAFTKEAVKLLKMGSDGLIVADLNEEGANLLALQTRQQLSTQALSLASQSDQAILRLFS
jgi:flagellin-like hook-associated protein FlgL